MFTKKGVTELTSFVFITLVVVIASSSAYVVATSYLDDTLQTLDRDRMEHNLKKMQEELTLIQSFDNTTVSFPLEFNTGALVFEDNQTFFQSEVRYVDTESFCFGGLCYQGVGTFERISFNLSSTYEFQNNLTLDPGSYVLIFRHLKNDKEIQIRFR